jgi:hypothetical protein
MAEIAIVGATVAGGGADRTCFAAATCFFPGIRFAGLPTAVTVNARRSAPRIQPRIGWRFTGTKQLNITCVDTGWRGQSSRRRRRWSLRPTISPTNQGEPFPVSAEITPRPPVTHPHRPLWNQQSRPANTMCFSAEPTLVSSRFVPTWARPRLSVGVPVAGMGDRHVVGVFLRRTWQRWSNDMASLPKQTDAFAIFTSASCRARASRLVLCCCD